MKEKMITALILLLAFTYAKGQDKIITTKNDTIFCRIISVSQTYIQYEQKSDKQNVIGKFIPIEQIQEYSHNSQGQKISENSPDINQWAEPFQRWRIGLQGGGAHLLSSFASSKSSMQEAGIPQSQIDDYHKQLRNGIYAGANIHYMIFPFLGFGVSYSLFSTSIQMNYNIRSNDYYYGYDIPSFYSMGEKDKIYVNYIGPSVIFQHWLDKNHRFRLNAELTVGYIRYREEDRLDPYQYVGYLILNRSSGSGYNLLTKGNSLGGNMQVSLEYYPLSWLSVGVNAGFFTTTFKTLNLSNSDTSIEQKLDRADYLNMSRLDYSIGLQFHF